MNTATQAFLGSVLWLGVVMVSAADDGQQRVSIPRLLDPATRAETLREFIRRSNLLSLGELTAEKDLATFVKTAKTIAVHPFPLHGAPAGYIVLRGIDDDQARSVKESDDPFVPGRLFTGRPRVLLPSQARYGSVIRADGTSDATENESATILGSRELLADFDGDGRCDSAGQGTLHFSVAEGRGAGEYEVETLRVSSLAKPESTALEVHWNLRHAGGEPTEWWGWWFEDADGDGVFDLCLGPARDGIAEARVTFRWDGEKAAWIGSGLGPGVPCRVSKGDPIGWEEALDEGKLTVPPAPPAAAEGFPAFPEDHIPVDDYSHPWKPHSLAGLDHAGLLDAMTRRRTMFDFVREMNQRERNLPDLWHADPREVARAMLRAHRDADSRDAIWVAFDAGDGEAPPEEGMLTIHDGPSGCFAPSGAAVTQLHCARAGSHLARFSTLTEWNSVAITGRRPEFEFRRTGLSHAEARQILQVVWWLSRAKLWRLTEENVGLLRTSTSDGYARVCLKTNGQRVEQWETRVVEGFRSSLLGGVTGSLDERTGFVNLVVWLFGEWVPELLGGSWSAEACSGFGHGHLPGAAFLARLHERAKQGLEDFLAGHGSEESAKVALQAVGANGWNDLRPLIQKVSAALPPPQAREARLREIDDVIASWIRKHGGEKADQHAYFARTESAKAEAALNKPKTENLPGAPGFPLDPLSFSTGDHWPVFSEQERQQFAPLDALYEEKSKLDGEQSPHERALAALRETVSETARELDLRDDPAGLEKWARESLRLDGFQLERLAAIAPVRAAAVLHARLPDADSMDADAIREALTLLAPIVPLPDDWPEAVLAGQRPPREDDLPQLSAHNPGDGRLNFSAFVNWVVAFVPPSDPHRYPWPALDRELLTLIKASHASSESLQALARRAPDGAWEAIVSQKEPVALALLATGHPEHRGELQKMLTAGLTKEGGYSDQHVFAAWLADLRETAPVLERLATSSAADAEGFSNPARNHLSRSVLTLWREPDAPARAKALLAFALCDAFGAEHLPEAWTRLDAQFTEAWRTLDERGRADVRSFLDWCEGEGQSRIAILTMGGKAASILKRLRGLLER